VNCQKKIQASDIVSTFLWQGDLPGVIDVMAREAARHIFDRVVFAGACLAQSLSDSIVT